MYDWKKELRQHLTNPEAPIVLGKPLNLKIGGRIVLTRDDVSVRIQYDSYSNIEVIEILVLRALFTTGRLTISIDRQKIYNTMLTAAICEYHGVWHNYRPHENEINQYRTIRVEATRTLAKKYHQAELPYHRLPDRGAKSYMERNRSFTRPALQALLILLALGLLVGHALHLRYLGMAVALVLWFSGIGVLATILNFHDNYAYRKFPTRKQIAMAILKRLNVSPDEL